MAHLQDALLTAAGQHLDDVVCPEALAGADNGGEHLLGDFRGVELLPGLQADVAPAAALLRPPLPQVLQHEPAAAAGQLGELHHPRQLLPDVPLLLRVLDLIDEVVLPDLVAVGVDEDALAGQSVPAGPARFLVVTLQGLGQVVVDDEADVGFVYAHAEGDGGDDDGYAVADEVFLGPAARVAVEPGVIGAGRQAPRVQVGGQGLGLLSGEAVDDGGLAAVSFQ